MDSVNVEYAFNEVERAVKVGKNLEIILDSCRLPSDKHDILLGYGKYLERNKSYLQEVSKNYPEEGPWQLGPWVAMTYGFVCAGMGYYLMNEMIFHAAMGGPFVGVVGMLFDFRRSGPYLDGQILLDNLNKESEEWKTEVTKKLELD